MLDFLNLVTETEVMLNQILVDYWGGFAVLVVNRLAGVAFGVLVANRYLKKKEA